MDRREDCFQFMYDCLDICRLARELVEASEAGKIPESTDFRQLTVKYHSFQNAILDIIDPA